MAGAEVEGKATPCQHPLGDFIRKWAAGILKECRTRLLQHLMPAGDEIEIAYQCTMNYLSCSMFLPIITLDDLQPKRSRTGAVGLRRIAENSKG